MLAVLLEKREVGRHHVDAQQFGFGKHHSRVNDDNVIAELHSHAVHAEFAEAAKRNNPELAIGHQMIRVAGLRDGEPSNRSLAKPFKNGASQAVPLKSRAPA